jgi:hypothetical protein
MLIGPVVKGQQMNAKCLMPKEVESAYRIPVGTLANWRNQGRGPGYIKYGRKILYPICELEKWCQINQVRTADSR